MGCFPAAFLAPLPSLPTGLNGVHSCDVVGGGVLNDQSNESDSHTTMPSSGTSLLHGLTGDKIECHQPDLKLGAATVRADAEGFGFCPSPMIGQTMELVKSLAPFLSNEEQIRLATASQQALSLFDIVLTKGSGEELLTKFCHKISPAKRCLCTSAVRLLNGLGIDEQEKILLSRIIIFHPCSDQDVRDTGELYEEACTALLHHMQVVAGVGVERKDPFTRYSRLLSAALFLKLLPPIQLNTQLFDSKSKTQALQGPQIISKENNNEKQ